MYILIVYRLDSLCSSSEQRCKQIRLLRLRKESRDRTSGAAAGLEGKIDREVAPPNHTAVDKATMTVVRRGRRREEEL